MPWLSIDPDCLVEENRGVPSGQVGDAPCRLVAMRRTVVVKGAAAAVANANVPVNEPVASWSRWWKYGIEGGLQMPEIPSADRPAISVRERENAAKEGTVRAKTVRLLGDYRTKESCVSGSNHFKQPND